MAPQGTSRALMSRPTQPFRPNRASRPGRGSVRLRSDGTTTRSVLRAAPSASLFGMCSENTKGTRRFAGPEASAPLGAKHRGAMGT